MLKARNPCKIPYSWLRVIHIKTGSFFLIHPWSWYQRNVSPADVTLQWRGWVDGTTFAVIRQLKACSFCIISFNTKRFIAWRWCHRLVLSLRSEHVFHLTNIFNEGVETDGRTLSDIYPPHLSTERPHHVFSSIHSLCEPCDRAL